MKIALAACPARNSHGKGSKVAKLPKHTLRVSKVETTTKTYLGISHNYTGFSGKRNLHHRHWLLLIHVMTVMHLSMYAPYTSIIPKGVGLTVPWHSVQKTVDGNAGVALDWTWVMDQSCWNYTKKTRSYEWKDLTKSYKSILISIQIPAVFISFNPLESSLKSTKSTVEPRRFQPFHGPIWGFGL